MTFIPDGPLCTEAAREIGRDYTGHIIGIAQYAVYETARANAMNLYYIIDAVRATTNRGYIWIRKLGDDYHIYHERRAALAGPADGGESDAESGVYS